MQAQEHMPHTMQGGHYGRLAGMAVLSFLAMYILMYAMVNAFENVFASLNQFYMAGLMTAPMVLIELGLMAPMYPNRKLNIAVAVVSVVFAILCWAAIREQAAISDDEFVRSMIPHHAGAILMCRKNRLSDPDLQQLCSEIIASQQSEIERMKAKLK